MDTSKLKIWSDGTDFVLAESAAQALTCITHSTGMAGEELSPVAEWEAYEDDEQFPWVEEEGGPTIQIPAKEAVQRLTDAAGEGDYFTQCSIDGCSCRTALYFASTEW
jgi:hypothetical protein